jgi:hypothetical protein
MTDETEQGLMSIDRSSSIAKIATAIAKAQTKISGAHKDKTNPHFKSKYATLASIWDAAHEALNAEGVAIVQMPRTIDSGIEIETMLAHSSGEWLSSRLTMPLTDRATAQQVGSAVTYGRRYALAAMTGVAPDDDDGNAASSAPPEPKSAPKAEPKAEYETIRQESMDLVLSLEDHVGKIDGPAMKTHREAAGVAPTGKMSLGDLKRWRDYLKQQIGALDYTDDGDQPPF